MKSEALKKQTPEEKALKFSKAAVSCAAAYFVIAAAVEIISVIVYIAVCALLMISIMETYSSAVIGTGLALLTFGLAIAFIICKIVVKVFLYVLLSAMGIFSVTALVLGIRALKNKETRTEKAIVATVLGALSAAYVCAIVQGILCRLFLWLMIISVLAIYYAIVTVILLVCCILLVFTA